MLLTLSIEEIKQLTLLFAIPVLVLVAFITAAVLIIRRLSRKGMDNSQEKIYAASIRKNRTEEKKEPKKTSRKEPEIIGYPQITSSEINSMESNATAELKQQIEALETETNEIKDELLFIQSNVGDGTEYRIMKNKWHEKQEQLIKLKIALNNSNHIPPPVAFTQKNDTDNNTIKHINEVEINMEHTNNTQPAVQNEMMILLEKNNSLTNELDQLKNECNTLKEQLSNVRTTPYTDREPGNMMVTESQIIDTISHTSAQAEEEIKILKEKIFELESIPEILKEKKTQIEFLQNQLDARVKASFHTEKEFAQLKDHLSHVNETVKQMTEQSEQLHRDLQNKEQYITHINSQYRDALQSIESHKKQLVEKNNEISTLQTELCMALQKLAINEDKLKMNNEIITKVYRNLQSIVHDVPSENPSFVENIMHEI